MHKVGQTILEGIALVFLILILFLGSPRSALVVAVTHSARAGGGVLAAQSHPRVGESSVAGRDRLRHSGRRRHRRDRSRCCAGARRCPNEELSEGEAKAATLQVTRPIFFASLIIITAYLPMFSFERAEAKLFTPMAYTMGYALFGALLTTLALVPGLAYMAFRKPGPRVSQPLAGAPDRVVRPRCSPPASISRGSSTAS